MRREGRIHGTNVRVNKKVFEPLERAASKPTNHSKVSARCPNNGVRCVGCSNGLPVKKSIGKVKAAFKARDLDVTKNHKMAEWSLSHKDRWGSNGEEREGDSDEAEGYWADDQHSRPPVIECPIELLVQMRKRKAVRAPAFVPEVLCIPIPTTDSDYESVIDDESWSVFEFSEGEEISSAEEDGEEISSAEDLAGDGVHGDLDWVLITEFE